MMHFSARRHCQQSDGTDSGELYMPLQHSVLVLEEQSHEPLPELQAPSSSICPMSGWIGLSSPALSWSTQQESVSPRATIPVDFALHSVTTLVRLVGSCMELSTAMGVQQFLSPHRASWEGRESTVKAKPVVEFVLFSTGSVPQASGVLSGGEHPRLSIGSTREMSIAGEQQLLSQDDIAPLAVSL